MSGTFDADLSATDCKACAQRVALVDGRCPVCVTLAARGKGAQRALAAPPWPRLVVTSGAPLVGPRGAQAEVSLATVAVLGLAPGEPPALRIEPRAGDAGLLCTALGAGVRVDGVDLAPGSARALSRGGALSVGDREARIL